MSTRTKQVETTAHERTFFGQPRVLANLFGVEMWERFSFYGMQGILLIYLYYSAAKGGLGIDQGTAAGIVGAYGGAVYLSTILGAWLADRLIGPERTLFYSAVVVMAGHLALSLVPGLAGVGVGLMLIAFGSGGVKANATSLVGSLYDEHDERRDAGFSIFYMGINLGALLGPACCRARGASTSASVSRPSGWPSASSSTPSAAATCPRRPTTCRTRSAVAPGPGTPSSAVPRSRSSSCSA